MYVCMYACMYVCMYVSSTMLPGHSSFIRYSTSTTTRETAEYVMAVNVSVCMSARLSLCWCIPLAEMETNAYIHCTNGQAASETMFFVYYVTK